MRKYLTLTGTNGNMYTFEKVPYKILRDKVIAYYNFGEGTTLEEVYGNYSIHKARAFNYCEIMNRNLNGDYGCILSHNTFMFTYAFIIHGETNYFVYITPNHNYICEL